MAIPKPRVFWPLTITATNGKVYFARGGTDFTGTIAAGTYLSPSDLATAVAAAMNALDGGNVYVVTVTSDGLFTVSGTFAFELRWGFLANSAASALGWFSVDTVSSVTQTANFQHVNGWYSPVAVRRDSEPLYEQENSVVTVALAGQSVFHGENELERRELVFDYLPPERTRITSEGGGANNNRAIERWWRDGRARFRYWPDGAQDGVSYDYFLDLDSLKKFEPARMDTKALYAVTLKLRRYVP